MRELMRVTDPVLISFVEAYLKDAGIEAFVMDTHTSILEGSIAVLIPRRVMVADDEYDQAVRLIKEADLEEHLFKGQGW